MNSSETPIETEITSNEDPINTQMTEEDFYNVETYTGLKPNMKEYMISVEKIKHHNSSTALSFEDLKPLMHRLVYYAHTKDQLITINIGKFVFVAGKMTSPAEIYQQYLAQLEMVPNKVEISPDEVREIEVIQYNIRKAHFPNISRKG